jgi:hypothetical protein
MPSAPSVTSAPKFLGPRADSWPSDLQKLIPRNVDTRLFSVDGNGNTEALASSHFPTVTVTNFKRAQAAATTTTARAGIYTDFSDPNKVQFSFQVSPELLEIIKKAGNAAVKRDLKGFPELEVGDNSTVRRQLSSDIPEFFPFDSRLRPAAEQIANQLTPNAAPGVVGADVGITTTVQEVVAVEAGAAEAGAVGVGAGTGFVLGPVALGFTAVAYSTIVVLASFYWAQLIHQVSQSPALKLPHAVVIDLTKLPIPGSCPAQLQSCNSDTCRGMVAVCTSGKLCKQS